MRLFGTPKWSGSEVASNQIVSSFLDLRKEFSERCLEALDWKNGWGNYPCTEQAGGSIRLF